MIRQTPVHARDLPAAAGQRHRYHPPHTFTTWATPGLFGALVMLTEGQPWMPAGLPAVLMGALADALVKPAGDQDRIAAPSGGVGGPPRGLLSILDAGELRMSARYVDSLL